MVEQVGINLVLTGEDKVKKAYADLSKAEDQLQQKMKVGANVGNKNAKSLDQIVTASKKAENEIRRLAQAKQQGKINSGQFQGELNKISARLRSMGMDKAQSQVFKLGRSYNLATTEVAKQTAELKKLQSALNQTATTKGRVTTATNNLSASKVRVAAAAKTTTDATSRTRQAFLNTANSIAILDGPLGGIASRFSAFGVLIGRTGIVLGLFAVGISALVLIMGTTIKSFIEAETAMLRIEGVLLATGGAAGVLAGDVESAAQRIASSTLASVGDMRNAAAQVLTFKNVSKEAFEDVLVAAQDMASLGFGTVGSEAVKLAKAIEDPRQSLTSLSRSGITFTITQRRLIMSLVETGRRAEATGEILKVVNAQVGGAAAKQAEGYAGSLDSVGQAWGNVKEAIGAFLLEDVKLGAVIKGAGRIASAYNDTKVVLPILERIARAQSESVKLTNELAQAEAARGTRGSRSHRNIVIIENELNDALRTSISLRRELLDSEIKQYQARRGRAQEFANEIQGEIDDRGRLIGLSREQTVVQDALNKAELSGTQTGEMAKLQALVAALALQRESVKAEEALNNSIRASTTSLEERLERQQVQNALHGTAPELMQLAIDKQLIINRAFNDGNRALSGAEQEYVNIIDRMMDAVKIALDLDRAASSVHLTFKDILSILENISGVDISGMFDKAATSVSTMNARLDLTIGKLGSILSAIGSIGFDTVAIEAETRALRAGRSAGQSRIEGQVAQERAKLEQMGAPEIAIRGAEIGLRSALEERLTAEQEREAALRDPKRTTRPVMRPMDLGAPDTPSGGGGSNVIDINEIIAAREQQIMQERILIGLSGQRRVEEEIYSDLMKQNKSANIKLTESEIRGEAQKLAALQQTNDVLKEQRDIQEQLGKFMESSMEKAFMSIVDGTMSVKDAFKSMASEIIKELYRVFVVKKITGMISSAFGGGGPSAAATSNAFSQSGAIYANGGVFSGGNVVPFANGGVVGGPTTFPMSGGKTGLMGEAGPEAIMPLKRGKDGKLGVTAEGGGNVTIVQNFNISANGDESVKRIVQQQIPRIAEATKAAVVDSKRRGGSYGRAFG